MAGRGGPGWRRRPPLPKRPVRWIDANSNTSGAEECEVTPSQVTCTPAGPRELVAGRIDLEYSDRNEATLVRLVGNIDIGWLSLIDGGGNWALPLFRLGILLVEEQEAGGSPTLNLFDTDTLERYEWLWLHQELGKPIVVPFGATNQIRGTVHIPVDLRVKRKAGRRDLLVLYRQFGVETGAVFDIGASMFVQLRSLAMS